MTSKVYISGGISGVKNYQKIFAKAEDQLVQAGYEVVNPATIEENIGGGWLNAMRNDLIVMLRECDKIALLPNWYASRGANVEWTLARNLGFEIGTVKQWIDRSERIGSSK